MGDGRHAYESEEDVKQRNVKGSVLLIALLVATVYVIVGMIENFGDGCYDVVNVGALERLPRRKWHTCPCEGDGYNTSDGTESGVSATILDSCTVPYEEAMRDHHTRQQIHEMAERYAAAGAPHLKLLEGRVWSRFVLEDAFGLRAGAKTHYFDTRSTPYIDADNVYSGYPYDAAIGGMDCTFGAPAAVQKEWDAGAEKLKLYIDDALALVCAEHNRAAKILRYALLEDARREGSGKTSSRKTQDHYYRSLRVENRSREPVYVQSAHAGRATMWDAKKECTVFHAAALQTISVTQAVVYGEWLRILRVGAETYTYLQQQEEEVNAIKRLENPLVFFPSPCHNASETPGIDQHTAAAATAFWVLLHATDALQDTPDASESLERAVTLCAQFQSDEGCEAETQEYCPGLCAAFIRDALVSVQPKYLDHVLEHLRVARNADPQYFLWNPFLPRDMFRWQISKTTLSDLYARNIESSA